ncbi:Fic family protein [Nannocystaceae bacterium ST9]
MVVGVWSLRWVDVDPSTHAFELARARAIVDERVPHRPSGAERLDEPRRALEDDLSRALVAEFGAWILGWCWSASEGGSGGPVDAYCCSDHSLVGHHGQITQTVTMAIRCWRERLEWLADEFDRLRREHAELALPDALAAAAGHLLPRVLAWTRGEDAWYSTYSRILAWYLEPSLADPDRALALIRAAIGGRFHSWIEPEPEVVADVTSSLREQVERELASPTIVDALAVWLEARASSNWRQARFHQPARVIRDGHLAFIEQHDRPRDPVRADRMLAALHEVRAHAERGGTLDFASLRAWQAIVLGEPVEFRSRDAFAHAGRERYGFAPDLPDRFDACLAEAHDDAIEATSRAARLYLDVAYVHPFADGNARAARLALDFVLTRAGLALHGAGPVFVVARRALDRYGQYALTHVIDYLAGPR